MARFDQAVHLPLSTRRQVAHRTSDELRPVPHPASLQFQRCPAPALPAEATTEDRCGLEIDCQSGRLEEEVRVFEISQRHTVLHVLPDVVAIENLCSMKREVQIENALSKRQQKRRKDVDGVELRRCEVGHHGAHLFDGGWVTSLDNTRVQVLNKMLLEDIQEEIGIALNRRRCWVSERRECVIDGERVC